MTWLTNESRDTAGEKLAALIRQPGIVAIPGAHNALAAMLAQKAGFQALYLSGAALTASLGLPDLGILGLEELSFFTRTICRATALPPKTFLPNHSSLLMRHRCEMARRWRAARARSSRYDMAHE